MVLCFYLLSQLDDGGDGLRGCQKPRGSSPSSISHPDGVRWGEKGSAVKSNGINPEGAFVPGGKTQCLRDRSAERAEKMCQGEKRNRKRGKKKNRTCCLERWWRTDSWDIKTKKWKQMECSVWPSPLLNSFFPFTSPHLQFSPFVTAIKQPGF